MLERLPPRERQALLERDGGAKAAQDDFLVPRDSRGGTGCLRPQLGGERRHAVRGGGCGHVGAKMDGVEGDRVKQETRGLCTRRVMNVMICIRAFVVSGTVGGGDLTREDRAAAEATIRQT